MKLVAKNAKKLYNFRNEIINTIKKEIGDESEKDKKIEELALHRPEEDLIELITNIEEDTDLKDEFYPNNARIKLLKFLNNVINKKINSEEEAKKVYENNFHAYKKELESKNVYSESRSKRIKKFIDDAEYIIFGPLFNPKKESEKLDIATDVGDIPESETEEEKELEEKLEKYVQNGKTKIQSAKGLKIMTPNELITRLPILLAQKQAGSNSQKLNNEIRQILCSLYRSNNLSKTIYNHLINSI